MVGWDDFVAFLKGTRPRPPPGPRSPLAFVLLIAASLAHLPLVYLYVRAPLAPPFALSVGALAMGLAWSGGCCLEGRRRGTVRAFALLAVAEGALVLVPVFAEPAGAARWWFSFIAVAAAGALVAMTRAR